MSKLVRNLPEEPALKFGLRRSCFNLGLSHLRRHEYEVAFAHYERALQLSRELVAAAPTVEEYQNALNKDIRVLSKKLSNRAWQLATAPEPTERNPQKALDAATRAVELQPDDANHWSNLGVARFRAGDWRDAVEALEKADAMIEGGDLVHRMFFAMAYWQLGDRQKARELYAQGAAWITEHRKNSEGQLRFRGEAEELMEIGEDDRERIIEQYLGRSTEKPAETPRESVKKQETKTEPEQHSTDS